MLKITELAESIRTKEDFDTVADNFRAVLTLKFAIDPCNPVEEEGRKTEMDTFGSLVDKLAIVTTRMWHAQDDLYRFRRMSDEEWEAEFGDDPMKVRNILTRACELNLQRNQLIDEIDKLNVEQLSMDEEDKKKLYQPKHKLY